MAENPLLPNDELRALLALTKRCAKLSRAPDRGKSHSAATRRGRTSLPSREALLAATVLQLKSGDLLIPETGDPIASQLAPGLTDSPEAVPALPQLGKNSSRLILAAAMAAALRGAHTDRLVLTYARAGMPEPEWAAALSWAQTRLLPLVVAFGDARGPDAFRPAAQASADAPTWEVVQRVAQRLQMPILSVDGEDAVAVYRVMQESVLRARAGAGPAILWAMLPSPRENAAGRLLSLSPVARLQRYLRARKISA